MRDTSGALWGCQVVATPSNLRLVDQPIKLAVAIGQNVRHERIKAELTLDGFAVGMRAMGFRWSTSRVVELENGKVSPTLGTLIGVCNVLSGSRAFDQGRVTIEGLLPREGFIEIAKGVTFPAHQLRALYLGSAGLVQSTEREQEWQTFAATFEHDLEKAKDLQAANWSRERVTRLLDRASLADVRAAKSLGISLVELMTVAHALWDETLPAERDRRADHDASAQARGRVSRELIEEARAYLTQARGNNG